MLTFISISINDKNDDQFTFALKHLYTQDKQMFNFFQDVLRRQT